MAGSGLRSSLCLSCRNLNWALTAIPTCVNFLELVIQEGGECKAEGERRNV